MMPSFTDATGRQWAFTLTRQRARAIEPEAEFPVSDLLNSSAHRRAKAANKLASDPAKVPRIVWLLCREQAEAAGIDEPAFCQRLNERTLLDLTTAFLQAVEQYGR